MVPLLLSDPAPITLVQFRRVLPLYPKPVAITVRAIRPERIARAVTAARITRAPRMLRTPRKQKLVVLPPQPQRTSRTIKHL